MVKQGENGDGIWHVKVSAVWLGVAVAVAGFVGSITPPALAFLGVTVQGPAELPVANAARIDTVAANIDTVRSDLQAMDSTLRQTRDLFTAYIVSNCMDPAQRRRLAEALMPCARLINERGLSPP